MNDIILASASPRRCELLKQMGLGFEIIPSKVDESFNEGMSPEEIVKDLSRRKALDVSKVVRDRALIIGADTVVVKSGILGKPGNRGEASNMLNMLQGAWHEVYTGIAVIDTSTGKVVSDCEKTRVKMRLMDNDMVDWYIATGEPMDKAGAYGIQGKGAMLVEKIEGCYFNVVGLPIFKLSNILKEFGIKVF